MNRRSFFKSIAGVSVGIYAAFLPSESVALSLPSGTVYPKFFAYIQMHPTPAKEMNDFYGREIYKIRVDKKGDLIKEPWELRIWPPK